LARLGGDEFAVLLPGTDRHEAVLVARALLERVRAETISAGDSPARSVSASAGVAVFEADARPLGDEVLVNADIAMYEAKEAGRDRVAVFAADAEQDAGM